MALRTLAGVLSLGAAATAALTHVGIAHQVHEMPNYRDKLPIDFHHYAGHIDLPSNGQKMFYWHVEAFESPESAPLVLWLNGGPGCSSLGGFFTEIGPFVVQRGLSVKRNPYTWARKANLIFLESPAGVGFSAPVLNATDYTDDFTTARAYEFLEQFLKGYPHLRGRPFYITGESYAGVYIPYLVEKLVLEPLDGINLQGYAIGNPFTDNKIDGNAYMDYYYTHALISMESYNAIVDACADELSNCMFSTANCSDACQAAVASSPITSDASYFNPYYIYGDVCLINNGQGDLLHLHHVGDLQPAHRGKVGPCTDRYTQDYLNLKHVQAALHVEGDIAWSDCNMKIAEVYHRAESSLPKYSTILGHNLSALIYSGDADAVVNFIGTERWIGAPAGLHLSVTKAWAAWFGPDKQLAGYSQDYAGLTFKTVKGAGHMVPAIRPLHSLYMFECFLFGDDACADFSYPKDNFEYLTGAETPDDKESPKIVVTAGWSWASAAAPLVSTGWSLLVGAVGGVACFGALQVLATQRNRAEYHDLSQRMEAHRLS
ncbi:serine protease family S10 [Achlya hypogyna]|uniref:Carboxypeptidase n=1 Tax=Achlya hypogyna TaxID=1202772 RepID=A0A1V9Z5G3_ACHHY|nr:serine protease family S10 [Achlya hypogyna]